MKKLMTALTVLALVLTLAACQSSADSETGTDSTPAIQSPQFSTAPAEKFDQILLVDDESATVRVTAIETDSLWGYTLKVFLENKTDKELMFTVDKVSVNGFMIDPFWAAAVDGGKKANEEISFLDSDFEENGIEAVEEITLTLRVYDSGDILADDLITKTVTIRP